MAVGRRPPTIRIGSTTLPASWDGRTLVALSGFVIDWGRDDLYAENEPTTVTIDVIDRTGAWGADSSLVGARVTITESGVPLFRGRVTGLQLTRIVIEDQSAWLVQLGATDTLGDLVRDVAVTTYNGNTNNDPLNVGGISMIDTRSRPVWLFTNSPLPRYVDAVEPGPFTMWGTLTYWRPSEKPTYYAVLSRSYRALLPFSVPQYMPATNTIEIGRLAPAPDGVKLTWSPPEIELSVTGTDTLTIPARVMEYTDDPPTIESTVADSITSVEVDYWQDTPQPVESQASQGVFIKQPVTARADTSIATAGRGSRILSIPTDIQNSQQIIIGPTDRGNSYAAMVVDVVERVNDKLKHPRVRYVFNRHAAAGFEDVLLRAYVQALGIFFAGSELAQIPNLPLTLQIIGGRITWADGWETELILAPAAGTAAAVVSIAQLVTNATPAFKDYSPEISLSDLGNVTEGAA